MQLDGCKQAPGNVMPRPPVTKPMVTGASNRSSHADFNNSVAWHWTIKNTVTPNTEGTDSLGC